MTAIEIQQDAIYAEAYKKAERVFQKKYDKLFSAAVNWMQIYNNAFGEPEHCPEYFTLQKLLDAK